MSAAAVRPLLVGNDFPPDTGGIQSYVAAVAARLPGVAVLAGAHDRSGDAHRGYPVIRGRRRFLWPTPATVALARHAVERHRARAVLFTAPFPLPPVGTHLPVPFAVLCHGAELVWPAATPLVSARYRRWLRAASCLFAVSRYTAGHLRTLVGPDGPPIRLLPPGVDLAHFRPVPSPPAPGRPRRIVSVGRLVPRKGVDVLLRALPLIRREVPGTELLVVGDGRVRGRLERQAAALVRHGRVPPGAISFTGRVDTADLPAVYATADVAVMPVRTRWGGLEQEGFGMVFIEAQACGVPVVVGRSGGAPETVADGRTGTIVDGADAAQVAAATAAILRDEDRRRGMAGAARVHVATHFAWERIVDRLRADLRAVAAGEGRHLPPDR